jgi:YebC/PmpR family DNA-binding regulatory protein
MGRSFEKRKHKMFARWSKMAKGFTKMGKEIAIAVKAGGPQPDANPRLRMAMQNAKAINMPKDRIEAAIKRASEKSSANFEEVVYEGYGPYGVAILIECATDNPIRTVANIRMYLTRAEGTLGTSGSLSFVFDRKGVFRVSAEGRNIEELELELIDHGMDEIEEDENELVIYTPFNDIGDMQKALEEKGIAVISAEKQRIPTSFKELTEEQEEEVNKLIEQIEDDDDVQAVYSNIK